MHKASPVYELACCFPSGAISCALLSLLAGETIKIVIEEYVQQLSGYFLQLKFDPELLFSSQFQYQNRIALEFNHLYHWHPLMPDSFTVGSQDYSYEQFLFNTTILVNHGVEALVDAFSRQSAGRVSFGGALVRVGGLWDPEDLDPNPGFLFCRMGTVPLLQSGCEHVFINSLVLLSVWRCQALPQLLGTQW